MSEHVSQTHEAQTPANDAVRHSIPLFRTVSVPDSFLVAPDSPVPITGDLTHEEIVSRAVGYFRTAARIASTVTLLRYHGAKGLLHVHRQQKKKKYWMAFCEEHGLSYWTLRNAFGLAKAVDEAVAAGTFALDDLANYGWNAALRKFGIKSSKVSRATATPVVPPVEVNVEAESDSASLPVASTAAPVIETPQAKCPAKTTRTKGKHLTRRNPPAVTAPLTDGQSAPVPDQNEWEDETTTEGPKQAKLPCLAHRYAEKQFGLAYSLRELLYQVWFTLDLIAGRVGTPDWPQDGVVQWDTMIPEMRDYLQKIEGAAATEGGEQ